MQRRFSLLILLVVVLAGGMAHAQTLMIIDDLPGLVVIGSCLVALGSALKRRFHS